MVLTFAPSTTEPLENVGKDEVILYSFYVCPFVQRVSLALTVKGIPFKEVFIPAAPTKKPAWFLEKFNPKGKVPVLQHNGHIILESDVIVEYINDAFPDTTPLYPADPADRATVRLFMGWIRENFISAMYGLLSVQPENVEGYKAKYEHFLKVLRDLNDFLVKHRKGGPFLMGEQLTIGDIMLAPFVHRASVLLTYYRHLEIPATPEYAVVTEYWNATINHPAVKDTALSADDLIKSYLDYSMGILVGPIGDNGLGVSSFDADDLPPSSRSLPPRAPRPSFLA